MEAFREIKERAKFMAESVSYRKFAKGLACFDKSRNFGISRILEKLTEFKLYLIKLSSEKSGYLVSKHNYQSQELIAKERMVFVNSLVRFMLVTCICSMSFALEMTTFEVFEVKQTIQDTLECDFNAHSLFKSNLDVEKGSTFIKANKISAKYLDVLTELHVQKSANSNVDTNKKLYSCYKDVHESSIKELDGLGWKLEEDRKCFSGLLKFLADQIQKRLSSSISDSKPSKDQDKHELQTNGQGPKKRSESAQLLFKDYDKEALGLLEPYGELFKADTFKNQPLNEKQNLIVPPITPQAQSHIQKEQAGIPIVQADNTFSQVSKPEKNNDQLSSLNESKENKLPGTSSQMDGKETKIAKEESKSNLLDKLDSIDITKKPPVPKKKKKRKQSRTFQIIE